MKRPAPARPEGVQPDTCLTPFATKSWRQTGLMRHRRRFLIGPLRMMVEEQRREFRPVVAGHSPGNWQSATRWRWATAAEQRAADEDWFRSELERAASRIPMPPVRRREMKMKQVRLLSWDGTEMGSASIPDDAVGPETIRRGDMIFVRRTHEVYIHATCCIVPEAA